MLTLFPGALLRFDDFPSYLFWYSRINFMRYGWAALMLNQFGNYSESEMKFIAGQSVIYYWVDTKL